MGPPEQIQIQPIWGQRSNKQDEIESPASPTHLQPCQNSYLLITLLACESQETCLWDILAGKSHIQGKLFFGVGLLVSFSVYLLVSISMMCNWIRKSQDRLYYRRRIFLPINNIFNSRVLSVLGPNFCSTSLFISAAA